MSPSPSGAQPDSPTPRRRDIHGSASTAAENATTPASEGKQGPAFFDANTLNFLGLIAFPVLALVCAVMGLTMVVQGHVLAGLIFLLVLTQGFAIGGLIMWTRRRRMGSDS